MTNYNKPKFFRYIITNHSMWTTKTRRKKCIQTTFCINDLKFLGKNHIFFKVQLFKQLYSFLLFFLAHGLQNYMKFENDSGFFILGKKYSPHISRLSSTFGGKAFIHTLLIHYLYLSRIFLTIKNFFYTFWYVKGTIWRFAEWFVFHRRKKIAFT